MPRAFILAGAVGLGLMGATAASADVPPQRQTALAHMLEHDCGSCHGMTRKGGLGSPLLPDALAAKDDAGLVAVILDGIPGTPMPPWRPMLSPEEAAWLVKRLKEGVKP